MYLFLALIFILYAVTSYGKKNLQSCCLSKQKTLYLKGICAVLIVNIHGAINTDIAFLEHIKSWGAPVVSLFLFISGYGLLSSYLAQQNSYLNGFFRKRIWKTAKPYLIATALFIGFEYLDKDSSLTLVYSSLMKGEPPLPYSWFVISIIIFYFAFYLIFLIPKLSVLDKIMGCIVFSVFYIALVITAGYDRCWWVSSLAFPTGLLFRYKERVFMKIGSSAVSSILFLITSCAIVYMLIRSKIEDLLPVAYIFIPLLIIIPVENLRFTNSSILRFFGKISYEIYLFHGFFYFLLRGNSIYIQSDFIYLMSVNSMTVLSAYLLSETLTFNTQSK